ncbi:hypothetical protein C8R44DRAFT_877966 [Mycena epipterygia]|nr:hypothetical protein C8R44DRAFT_877966 [Mycena epipterygia]
MRTATFTVSVARFDSAQRYRCHFRLVPSDNDQQVMATIQSRFMVAVPELPDHIDPARYMTS